MITTGDTNAPEAGFICPACDKFIESASAIGIMRKVNAISDVQLMNLRDRGDVVSPLHLIIR